MPILFQSLLSHGFPSHGPASNWLRSWTHLSGVPGPCQVEDAPPARPAAVILPGHVTRLHVLDLGLFEIRGGARVIGIPGFLMETDRGARILFDTGFPPAYASDPGISARDGLPGFGRLIDYRPEQTAEGALASLGLTPRDITLTVLSHSHIDHVGSLPLFAHAPILLTARERAEPRPLYFGHARPMAWPRASYQLIETATPVCEGLTLIPTPGHTPGHLSAILDLPGQRLILAADAINRASEPAEGFPDALDPVTAKTSAEALLALAGPKARLIYGHDPAQWPTLPKAPQPW